MFRVSYAPAVVRERIATNGHVRLGTVRLRLERALPGTVGILLSANRYPGALPVEMEDILLDSPAAKAGLQRGDELLEIDGVPVDVANAERLMRGPPGTAVTVNARRHLQMRNGTLRHVRPRLHALTIVRAPGRPTRRRHAMWRA